MENFRKKFLEEASEHVAELEQALLELEQNPEDAGHVERVFRSMHSLKGGGAMFGLENVSTFTHDLETIYDMVRNNEMKVSRGLLDVTLKSVDHLSSLLKNDDDMDENMVEEHNMLLEKIKSFISKEDNKQLKAQTNKEETADTDIQESNKDGFSTYYLLFKPNPDILSNGTNPLYLVDEVVELGEAFVVPHLHNLPEIENLNPENCYCYWEIILSTDKDSNAINDVFIFVEDNSIIEIEKISDQNLVSNKTFIRKLTKLIDNENDLGIHACISLAKSIKPSVASKVKKVINDKNLQPVRENSISSIRVSSDKLDELMNLVSELVTTQARLSLLAEQSDIAELSIIAENVQKLTRQLRDNAFSIVLIPIENMLTRFQRLIRDLSGELKKEVVFKATGTDTELDKTIIENLTDPLMHILRNSLDHGIESPHEREKAGKPRTGTIHLHAYYSGANVYIEISDDGKGLDREKIRQKAVQKELISPDTQLSDKEIYDLIFMSGFSTASNVTDVSGRGVGMDVVKKKISNIRGDIEVHSVTGKGTTITFKLPLTLSIIDGLLVKVKDTHFIIPLAVVDKIYACEHKKLAKAFNNHIVFDGVQIPFFNLRDEFDISETDEEVEEVVVVSFEDKRVGLTVDSVVGEYQAVLKPLGKHYKNQEIISGATILGDGTIALVMDTNKAIKKFSTNKELMEDVV